MFEKIFEEIFGNEFLDNLKDGFEKSVKNLEKDDEDEKDSSYYHKITEEYENGRCVSRSEKEIKNGQVIKDVTEVHKLEDKKCDNEKCEIDYEQKCKEYEEVIKNLKGELREKDNRVEYLEKKLENFKQKISALL